MIIQVSVFVQLCDDFFIGCFLLIGFQVDVILLLLIVPGVFLLWSIDRFSARFLQSSGSFLQFLWALLLLFGPKVVAIWSGQEVGDDFEFKKNNMMGSSSKMIITASSLSTSTRESLLTLVLCLIICNHLF